MRFIAERLLIKKILYAPKIVLKLYLCVSIIFLSLSACTRPQSEESTSGTKIYLTLPATLSNSSGKMNAASAPTLEHVILNINGSGMVPIFYSWDSCRDCATATNPPASFTFDIPQGSSRLFQVLAVYKTDDGQMIFKYGDMVKDLSAAEETVPIVIASLGDGAYAVSGQISGRIIDTDSGATASGPTGDVDIKFNPGNGKPALTISHGVITNGWFSFFGITGASFDYILKDTGRNLFNGSVDLNSFTPSDTVLKVAIPKHQRKTYISGTVAWIADEPQIYIWGYFGDAAAGITGSERKICRDFSAGFTSMATADSGQSGSPVLTKTLLSPGSDFPTNVNLFNANLSAVSYKGGVSVTSGTCVGVTLDSNNLFYRFQEITSTLIDGNGKDSSAGFFNPFQSKIIGSSPQPFELSGSTSNLTLVGGLLPGERESLSEILLFKTNNTNLENAHEDSLNCDEIVSGWGGFVPAGTLDVTSLANNSWSMSTNISTAESQTTGFKAIMCMRTSGGLGSQILKTGVVLHSHLFTCSSCKTLHMSWSNTSFNTTPPNLYLGQCPSITGELKQNGSLVNAGSSISVSYTNTNATLWPYQGAATALSSLTVSGGSSSFSGGACLQPTVVGTDLLITGWSISATESVLIDDSLLTWSAQKAQLKSIVPATLVKNNIGGDIPICYPVLWKFYDVDNLPINISVNNVGLQFGAELEVFSDLSTCQTGGSSSIASGATSNLNNVNIFNSTQYYVRVLNSTSATSNLMTSSDAGNMVTHGNSTTALNAGPGENASIELSLEAGPYQTGECYSIKASLQNSAGNPVVAKTDLTFSLNFSAFDKVKIYSDETCTSVGTGSYQIMSGQFEKNLSFRSFESVGTLYLSGISGAVRIDSPAVVGSPISIEDHIGAEPVLSLSVPNIKTSTLASGQALEIAITKDAGATLVCEKSTDGGATYSSCSTGANGNFDSSASKIILWATSFSYNDWQSSVEFKITANLAGQTKTIYLNPYEIFGNVTVMDCTYTVDSSAGGFSFSANVDSVYTSANVVCLKSGVYVGNLIRPNLTSGDHPSLVGYLDPANGALVVTWSPTSYSNVPILSLTNTVAGGQSMSLANIQVNDSAWNGSGTGLIYTNLGNHFLTVDGVSVTLSAANNSAFKRVGSSFISLKNMDFNIQAACANCFAFESSAVASITYANNFDFTINNATAYAISLGFTNTFSLDVSSATGLGGFLSRTAGSINSMEFNNLKIAQAGSTNRTFLLKENDHLQLKNSFVQTASVAQMFYLDVTSATTPPRVSLIDSKLKMMSNAPLISSSAYVTTATVGNPNLITTRTHIIRAGSGAATSYMAEPYNASTWYWGKHNLGSPGVSLTGDSKVCRTGSLNWQGLVSAGSTFQLTDGIGASALPTVGTSTDGDFCD